MTTRRKSEKTLGEARALAGALESPRYEVLPLPGIEDRILRHVPRHVELTVTASPKKGLGPTLALCERLAGAGYRVAPHLSARLVEDEAHLAEILGRLERAGVRDAFVVAGDSEEPAGKFEDSQGLLAAMAQMEHPLEEIGIAGYPESHPIISDAETVRAMLEKAPHATYLVSQMCFDPETIASWVRAVRGRGVSLPLYVGIPGAVSRRKLVRVSASIGVGESARFLRKNRGRLLRMFLPGGYSPRRLVEGLSPHVADPAYAIRGFHVFTFNEVEGTERWRREALERLGKSADGKSNGVLDAPESAAGLVRSAFPGRS